MLVKDKGTFLKGILLLITFFIVLAIMLFSNWFGGENALKASDRLFNSIAKGSTNFFPGLLKKNETFMGKDFEVTVTFNSDDMFAKASKILSASGAQVAPKDKQLSVKGDMGKVLGAALQDSQAMFDNRDQDLESRYGIAGKKALFVWWSFFKEMDKDLKRQKRFKEAKFVEEVVKRGVEVGFNFFGITATTARSQAGILTFALVFYVIYTLWFGIGVLFVFEGFGLEMKKGTRKEV